VTAPTSIIVQGATLDELVDRVAERVVELTATSAPAARPVLLDRRGLAAALGVGVDTVDRLRREGAPELTIGDAPRFELDRVLEWVRGRT
jgi:hypothetical protein